MAEGSRLVVLDNDRSLRDQLDRLVALRIYGTNASDVVRILVAQAHTKHFDGRKVEEVLREQGE